MVIATPDIERALLAYEPAGSAANGLAGAEGGTLQAVGFYIEEKVAMPLLVTTLHPILVPASFAVLDASAHMDIEQKVSVVTTGGPCDTVSGTKCINFVVSTAVCFSVLQHPIALPCSSRWRHLCTTFRRFSQ